MKKCRRCGAAFSYEHTCPVCGKRIKKSKRSRRDNLLTSLGILLGISSIILLLVVSFYISDKNSNYKITDHKKKVAKETKVEEPEEIVYPTLDIELGKYVNGPGPKALCVTLKDTSNGKVIVDIGSISEPNKYADIEVPIVVHNIAKNDEMSLSVEDKSLTISAIVDDISYCEDLDLEQQLMYSKLEPEN